MRPVRVTMADRAIRPAQAAIPLQQFRIARIGGAARGKSSRDSDARTGTYARMFAVLLLLCLLMVVGAIICAAAVLRMWSDDSKDS